MYSGLPHSEQWARSAKDEYRVFFREEAPEVHVIADIGNEVKLRNGAPERRRQVRQWQFTMLEGREVLV